VSFLSNAPIKLGWIKAAYLMGAIPLQESRYTGGHVVAQLPKQLDVPLISFAK